MSKLVKSIATINVNEYGTSFVFTGKTADGEGKQSQFLHQVTGFHTQLREKLKRATWLHHLLPTTEQRNEPIRLWTPSTMMCNSIQFDY